MPLLNEILMNALGPEEDENQLPSQVLAGAKPAIGPPVPSQAPQEVMPVPTPSQAMMPPPPPQDDFLTSEPADLTDINGTNVKAKLMRSQQQGTSLDQNFQPVIDGATIKAEFEKNQRVMDMLRKKIEADPTQQTREEISQRFGKGWGGFGKRFLTEMMLAAGGESVTGRMMSRYEKDKAEASKNFQLLSQNQNVMMQAARGQDTTMSGLMKAEALNRVNEFKAVNKADYDEGRLKVMQDQIQINQNNSLSTRQQSQARIDRWTKEQSMLELTGRSQQTNSGVAGHTTALSAIMGDDGLYSEYQRNPNDSSKWSPGLKTAYVKAFNQGSKEFEEAEARRKASNRSSGTGVRFAQGMEFDPETGRMNSVLHMISRSGGQASYGGKIELGPQYSNDDRDRLFAAQGAMSRMAEAFDNIASLPQRERDSKFGLIGGSDIAVQLRQSGLLSGYDNIKDAKTLLASQGALENWVKSLYEYSGKQINQSEMKAIRGFIANLKSDAQVYETMSLISYYRAMINRAAFYPKDDPRFKLKVNPGMDFSKALLQAVNLGINSSYAKRQGAKIDPIRLDKDGTGNQLAMILAGDTKGLAASLGKSEDMIINLMKSAK